ADHLRMVCQPLLPPERPIAASRELPDQTNDPLEAALSRSRLGEELPLAEHDVQYALQVTDAPVHHLAVQVFRVLEDRLAEPRRQVKCLVVEVLDCVQRTVTRRHNTRADQDCGG